MASVGDAEQLLAAVVDFVETSSAFVLPGDSGSLVVTDDVNANPVGLLFAGNADGTMAIVNPIESVLQYFHVTIDGKVTQ